MSRKPSRKRHAPEALTDLESRFVAEYMVDFDGTNALRRAGSTAAYPAQQAYEMLRKPRIASEIETRIATRNEKAAINAQWVLNELGLLYGVNKAVAMAPAENGKRNHAALKECRTLLETMGKHVNVNAFRSMLGIGNPDGSNFDLSGLSDEQLDQLESILTAVALTGENPRGEGEALH